MRHHGAVASSLPVYQRALEAYVNAGQCDRALALLPTMRKQHLTPTIPCYELVLQACQRASRPHNARDVWKDMVERSHLTPSLACLNAIVGCCPVDDAVRLLHEWREVADATTYEVVLNEYAKEGDWRMALEVLGSMGLVMPDSGCYGAVMTACAEGGQWEECLKLLEEMKANGVEAQESHYLSAMQGCAKAGKASQVVDLVKAMEDDGITPEASHYQTAMWCCLQLQDANQAVQLFNDLEQKGVRADRRTYLTLLHAYKKLGMGKEARETLKVMKKEGLTRNDMQVFRMVFWILCEDGLHKEAAEMVEGASKEEKDGVMVVVGKEVVAMSQKGRRAEALTWLRDLYNKGMEQGEKRSTGPLRRITSHVRSHLFRRPPFPQAWSPYSVLCRS